MFFERYDKNIIEEFAIRTISKSYNKDYGLYRQPNDTDDFDGVSSSGEYALEITLVISPNNMSAYVYEKLFSQGKNSLQYKHIKGAKLKSNKELFQWQGDISQIKNLLQEAISKKEEKTRQRLSKTSYKSVDLCVCVEDNGWFASENEFCLFVGNNVFKETLFRKIFIITSRLFLVYENNKINDLVNVYNLSLNHP